MRIVYVLTSLGIGGAERQALTIADRMAQRGHSVAILVLRPVVLDEWPTTLPVIHLNIHKLPGTTLTGLARAHRFLREFRPDLLHSHSFHANIFARLLRFLHPSVTVISTVHNVYEGGGPRMLAYRLTDSLTSLTTAVSQAAADRFIHIKAVHPHKCTVVLNGIDISEFTPNPDRRKLIREKLGAGADFIWLAAGRLVPAKDYPNLLSAFKQVRVDSPRAQLWIAGLPPDAKSVRTSDGRKDYVFGFVAERSSMEQVRLLGLRRDMPALLDAADGFVQASAWEGMPLAVGEAMAMAKPIVATDAGGTREMVGNAGVILPCKNSDALATAMLQLMHESEAYRQKLGQAARTRIAQDFSIDARADQWEKLYRRVIAPKP